MCETTMKIARAVTASLPAAISRARAELAVFIRRRQTARAGASGGTNLRLRLESSAIRRPNIMTVARERLRVFMSCRKMLPTIAGRRTPATGSTALDSIRQNAVDWVAVQVCGKLDGRPEAMIRLL